MAWDMWDDPFSSGKRKSKKSRVEEVGEGFKELGTKINKGWEISRPTINKGIAAAKGKYAEFKQKYKENRLKAKFKKKGLEVY